MCANILSLPAILAVSLVACQKPLTAGRAHPDYTITRLHRKNASSFPYVFGTAYAQDSTGLNQYSNTFVMIDKKILLMTENNGRYAYPLPSGRHELFGSAFGYSKVQVKRLTLLNGDSIQVDFYLYKKKGDVGSIP